MLTRFFLQKSAKELGVEAKRITDEALQRLMAFDFPGNVRQLENLCHWLTVMAPSQVVEAKDLPPELLAARRQCHAPTGRPVQKPPTGACRRAGAGAAGRADAAAVPAARRQLAGRPGARGAQPARGGRARRLGHADAQVRRRS